MLNRAIVKRPALRSSAGADGIDLLPVGAARDLSTGLGFWDLVLRKLAHAGVYAALTVLWFRALAPMTPRAFVLAATISFLYAITDEYHQSFVSGRRGSTLDVGIDAIGIGAAVLIVWSWGPDGLRRGAGVEPPRG